jgi:protein gp37
MMRNGAFNILEADFSNIGWTHWTFNPWVGCDKVAPECIHCYIDRDIRKQVDWQGPQAMGKHYKREPWGKLYLTKTWHDPYQWHLRLKKTPGIYGRVFTCSLSDFFHANVDGRVIGNNARPTHLKVAERLLQKPKVSVPSKWKCMDVHWRDAAWHLIKETPNLVYLILTKRPERIVSQLPKDWGDGYPNVWLGTSVGCNFTLSKIDSLRKVPVHPDAVRFVSCEPLLEDIAKNINLDGIGWLISGGESGTNPEYQYDPNADWKSDLKNVKPGRRTMNIMWAYSLMLKAKRHGIPFFFKQVTASQSGQGEDALGFRIQEFPNPPNGGTWAAKDTQKGGST